MSTTRKTRRKRTKEETTTTPQVAPQLTPEQQRLQELMKQLVNEATNLIVKVAVCECNHKETCPVFLGAKRIAKIIDEIMSLRQA